MNGRARRRIVIPSLLFHGAGLCSDHGVLVHIRHIDRNRGGRGQARERRRRRGSIRHLSCEEIRALSLEVESGAASHYRELARRWIHTKDRGARDDVVRR